MHALVSDPGGVLPTRQSVVRTAAFRPVDDVGILPYKRDYPNDHDYTFFGAQYTACILDPSGFGLSSRSWPADFTTDLVANL
jgi:hypothetical protein